MKNVASLFLLLLLSACSSISEETAPAELLLLGQEPPGLTPKPFAPGLVSTENWEGSGVFSPDMKEFYLRRMGGKYEKMVSTVFQYKDNEWQESIITPRMGSAFISPDGKIMHLGKRYKERTEDGWSEIKELGGKFADISIMRLTSSSKGTYYFDEFTPDGDAKIFYSRIVNGVREDPKVAGAEINSGARRAHPFIAPDESYLMWDDKREGGFGDSDIYISFRQQDGSWGGAINLGDAINTDAWEAEARVTPDGKYLFFNRNMGSSDYENVDIFWVDAQIIESLRN